MRIAVIGMGMMGQLHTRTMSGLPDLELVGVEVDETTRAAVQDRLGVAVHAALSDDLLASVDAVVVTLPDHLHVDIATRALAAGKYVLVEKPLAATVAECDQILSAELTPGRLMVGHVLRFDERLRELRRRLEAGAVGTVQYIRIHRANSVNSAERLAGRVSVVGFLGVHDLDLLLWLTGQRIESVTARGRSVHTSTWDVVTASLQLSDGTLGQVDNHWLLHRSSARSLLAGVEVFGDRGTALVDLSTGELELITDSDPRSVRVDSHNWTHDAAVSGGSLHRQAVAFIDAVRSGSAVPVTGEDGRRAVDAVERIETALASSA